MRSDQSCAHPHPRARTPCQHSDSCSGHYSGERIERQDVAHPYVQPAHIAVVKYAPQTNKKDKDPSDPQKLKEWRIQPDPEVIKPLFDRRRIFTLPIGARGA
jgi:hypothetical protein